MQQHKETQREKPPSRPRHALKHAKSFGSRWPQSSRPTQALQHSLYNAKHPNGPEINLENPHGTSIHTAKKSQQTAQHKHQHNSAQQIPAQQ